MSPLEFEELFGDSYFIAPMFLNRENFAGPVEYVPNVEEIYSKSIFRQVSPSGHVNLKIDKLPKLPRYKNEEWTFQSEYRFSLFAMPSLPVPKEGPGSITFLEKIGAHISDAFINNVDTGISYLDISINPAVFEDLVVRTGPLCTPGGKVCVEALLNQYAPRAKLEASALTGAIRQRR